MDELVLVVEDEAMIALDLTETLHDAGYRTSLAGTALEAAAAVAAERPSVAIVDFHLSDGLTGPEIARVLHRAGIPVIVSSVEASLYDVPAAARLPKPYHAGKLLEAVHCLAVGGHC